MRDLLRRNAGRRGCRRLADALDATASTALERRVEEILNGSGLPPHRREYSVGRYRLDFAWPRRRVAVEADGRRWHSSRADFARDRAKHNALLASGWRVLRVTPDDEPGASRSSPDSSRPPALILGLPGQPISIQVWR